MENNNTPINKLGSLGQSEVPSGIQEVARSIVGPAKYLS